jgi:tetratricopeptide (TPR) repeat protein
LQEQGKFAEALEAYRPSLEISDRLAQSDPNNANLQDELAAAYSRLANAQGFGGDWTAAVASLQAALAIRDALAKADPGNPFRQNQLVLSYSRLVTAYGQQKDVADMRKALDAGREIVLRLMAAYPDVAVYKDELAWFDRQIAAAGN